MRKTIYFLLTLIFLSTCKTDKPKPEIVSQRRVTNAVAGIDPLEYPPGHPNYTNVETATKQLQTYPVPRYKAGHTLMQNFNWIDPQWMSSRWQSGVSDAQAVTNSVDIQTELAKTYNYYVMVSWSSDNFNSAWKALANANLTFKVGLITLRAQVGGTKLWDQTLTAPHYLQNSSGQYLDPDGNVQGQKFWRPTAPIADYAADGTRAKGYIQSALSGLTNTVDMVNENGEVFIIYSHNAMAADPQVNSAKNASGLDWDMFHARKVAENEIQAYRDYILSASQLAGAKFTEYRMDGHREWNFRWEEMRNIASPINGQRYSTADFYVRWPNNWKDWQGPWHGLRWMTESRHYEIAAGDRLFSPFVAAGWDDNEELNVRPAQWLGLLKLLNIYGAEFFYSSYFNLDFSQSNPPPNPKGYAWQAAMPSYAQAMMSHAEKILREGDLMAGDMTNNLHNPAIPYYQFYTGKTNYVVAVRKSGSKYLITGTIQNSSNQIGDAPLSDVCTINLEGQPLTFKIRRQGSTYIYDPVAKIFYQLDGWHEYSHPSRWQKDIEIEAELFDNTTGTIRSYYATPNLTNFKSVIALSPSQNAAYSFTNRATLNTLFIKASGTGELQTTLDGAQRSIAVNGDGWYKLDLGNLAENKYSLLLTSQSNLEIDSISITSNPNKYPTVIVPPVTCLPPTDIGISGITTTGCRVNWTNVSTHVKTLIYFTSAAGTKRYQKASTTPKPDVKWINDLTPATSYQAYIRTVCAVGDTSAPTMIVPFNTGSPMEPMVTK